jgi:hypothetical protein
MERVERVFYIIPGILYIQEYSFRYSIIITISIYLNILLLEYVWNIYGISMERGFVCGKTLHIVQLGDE